MRVRDHVLLSTLAAATLYPALGRKALVPWAASIFIDVDHYAWYCLKHRSFNLREAIRYFGQAQPEQHAGTRRLHSLDVLLAVGIASIWWWPLRLVLAGLVFHVSLDALHAARIATARELTLERDHATCRCCGVSDETVVAHMWRQPPVLPSYQPDTLVSLCGPCHEIAHRVGPDFIQRVLSPTDRSEGEREPVPVKELAREN